MKQFLYLTLLIILPSLYTHAQIYPYPYNNPSYQLKQIETEHFRIIFNEHSQEKAFEVAEYAEAELKSLEEYYGDFVLQDYIPNQQIRVVVSSDFQQGNAFASSFIYPTIHLYSSVPPLQSQSHSYTGADPFRSIFRHELAHIVSLFIRKYFKNGLLNAVNYTVNPVAIFAPRSFLEATAINRESYQSSGREKDPYVAHLIRRTLLDNEFPSFATFSGANTFFDTGHYPYTYGSKFSQYLDSINTNINLNFFKESGTWKIASWALKNASKIAQKELYQNFKAQLYPKESFQSNTNFLFSQKDRRIHSVQRINNKIYYYDSQQRSLYSYDLTTKKNHFELFGDSTWEKISISSDEKLLLVSGTYDTPDTKFSIILYKKTKLPFSKQYNGIYDASFIENSSIERPDFFAINIKDNFQKLLLITKETQKILLTGSRYHTFDSPTSVDENFVYLLQNNNGKSELARLDLNSLRLSSLQSKDLNFPRFLNKDGQIISVSYAEGANGFYKRALLSNQQIIFIQNNIKGEIFDSFSDDKDLYYRSSFAKSDNFMQLALSELSNKISPANFTIQTPKQTQHTPYTGQIHKYQHSPDLAPMFWAPNITAQDAGIRTIISDSTGGNFIIAGVDFEYIRGTSQFHFEWLNTVLPVNFRVRALNRYTLGNSTFQFGQHLSVFTSFNMNWVIPTSLNGTFQVGLTSTWIGRFFGNLNDYPLLWNQLQQQQFILTPYFDWRYSVSEGLFGFQRLIHTRLQYSVDTLHPQWQRAEFLINLSPPIIPLYIRNYTAYDTSQLSVRGSSALGNSLFSGFREYQNLAIFSKIVNFTQFRLMLYSWEIQNGLGFGEAFINRLAFWSGYRVGYFGTHNPLLQSVFASTQLDFSILSGNVPFSFQAEINYAITSKKLGYNVSFNASLPI